MLFKATDDWKDLSSSIKVSWISFFETAFLRSSWYFLFSKRLLWSRLFKSLIFLSAFCSFFDNSRIRFSSCLSLALFSDFLKVIKPPFRFKCQVPWGIYFQWYRTLIRILIFWSMLENWIQLFIRWRLIISWFKIFFVKNLSGIINSFTKIFSFFWLKKIRPCI